MQVPSQNDFSDSIIKQAKQERQTAHANNSQCSYFKGFTVFLKTLTKNPEEVAKMVLEGEIRLDPENIRWLNKKDLQALKTMYTNLQTNKDQDRVSFISLPDLKKAIINARNNEVANELGSLLETVTLSAQNLEVQKLGAEIEKSDELSGDSIDKLNCLQTSLGALSSEDRVKLMQTWDLKPTNKLIHFLNAHFICDYFVAQFRNGNNSKQLPQQLLSCLAEKMAGDELDDGRRFETFIKTFTEELLQFRHSDKIFFTAVATWFSEQNVFQESTWWLTIRKKTNSDDDEKINQLACKIGNALRESIPK